MIGKVKRKVNQWKFKLNLRRALEEESDECLMWTLAEVKREIERRNKK